MWPPSPLLHYTSPFSPYLLPVPEVDLLSDISEEDPFGEAERLTRDSLALLSTGEISAQGDTEAAPAVAPPHPDRPPIREKTRYG